MNGDDLTWRTALLPADVLQVAFAGKGNSGSEGNADGNQMSRAIQSLITDHRPKALLIDLTDYEYRYGDWIAAPALLAMRLLGRGKVCLLATGATGVAVRSLWSASRLDRLLRIVADVTEGVAYLDSSADDSK
jgi:hypothetical protein